MKKYKNIYINGCSFTAGDNIEEGLTWPELLAKKLNLYLINHSVNANSMQSITFNSVNHLSKLNNQDTLVVIGLTWPSRYMIQIGKGVVNISPAFFNKSDKRVAFSTFRRFSSPYSKNKIDIDSYVSDINEQDSVISLEKFTDYYKSLIQYDDNLDENQKLNQITQIILLQSFLKQNNFEYKFVSFFDQLKEMDLPIYNKLDKSKIVNFRDSWRDLYIDETSHPTKEGCVNISEVLYDSFNR